MFFWNSLAFSMIQRMLDHRKSKRVGRMQTTKEPLDESGKVSLKLSIQKTKIMAFGPITLWQIDGETMAVRDFIFLGSQITAAMKLKDTFSLEEKL